MPGGKAEKRLERKALKLERHLEKKVRQFASVPAAKSVSQIVAPNEQKKITETPITPSQRIMTWSPDVEDRKEHWSWGQNRDWGDDVWRDLLLPFLTECGKKKWGVIDSECTGSGKKRRRKHVFYDFTKIKQEAYNRLVQLKLEDFSPSIFRFRLSGKSRFYGFRREHKFYNLWWDPDHMIYRGADD